MKAEKCLLFFNVIISFSVDFVLIFVQIHTVAVVLVNFIDFL